MGERRFGHRIALEIFLNEYVDDRLYRCIATDVSEHGLHLQKLSRAAPSRRDAMQLEFELPGIGETIWARGEIAFQKRDSFFQETGVRLTGIARLHARMLRDYVVETRRERLAQLLHQIRGARLH
jgi:hypothetical protein